jgi:hypothetical protein
MILLSYLINDVIIASYFIILHHYCAICHLYCSLTRSHTRLCQVLSYLPHVCHMPYCSMPYAHLVFASCFVLIVLLDHMLYVVLVWTTEYGRSIVFLIFFFVI